MSGASDAGAGAGEVISPSESLSLSSLPPNAKKESGSFFFGGGRALPFFAGASVFFDGGAGAGAGVGAAAAAPLPFRGALVFCRFGCLTN